MSQAFVEGKNRKTFELTTPEGYVRLHFSGKMGASGTREFKRPIPFVQRSLDENDPMVVGRDRICFATEDEAVYLVGLGGGFTRWAPDPRYEMPELQEDKPETTTSTPDPEPVATVELQPDPPKKKGGIFRKKASVTSEGSNT